MMMEITDRESCYRGLGLLLDGPDHVLRERPLVLNCQRNMGELGTLLVTSKQNLGILKKIGRAENAERNVEDGGSASGVSEGNEDFVRSWVEDVVLHSVKKQAWFCRSTERVGSHNQK